MGIIASSLFEKILIGTHTFREESDVFWTWHPQSKLDVIGILSKSKYIKNSQPIKLKVAWFTQLNVAT